MFNLFKKWFGQSQPVNQQKSQQAKRKKKVAPVRIGELGEHKINIQLDQLPKSCKYISDLMLENPKSRTGFSQIDHVVIAPEAVFVIETKNVYGEIRGKKDDRYWRVNNRFNMYNPVRQNAGHIKALQERLSELSSIPYISLISFTMRCRFNVEPELRKIDSNDLIVYDVELSEFIQRKINRLKMTKSAGTLTNSEVERAYGLLQQLNITDPVLREQHVKRVPK